MTATIAPAPVRKSVTVACPPARAFEVFAARMGTWWLRSHSIAPGGQADVVVEPRTGGRWYEVGTGGDTCDWGEVKLWAPPHRLVLIWRLTPAFTFDPALTTELEVTFTAEGTGTRVVLEHRGLENYGKDAARMRETFDGPDAWAGLLAGYAAAAA
jgi:uncharacterized protein YndB with AHSA1/START domain